MRLADGQLQSEGRVEVCINDTWGTVTDNGWRWNDDILYFNKEIVCRDLGYSSQGKYYYYTCNYFIIILIILKCLNF